VTAVVGAAVVVELPVIVLQLSVWQQNKPVAVPLTILPVEVHDAIQPLENKFDPLGLPGVGAI